MSSILRRLQNTLLAIRMLIYKIWYWPKLLAEVKNPRQTQTKLLINILRAGRETTFGKRYSFSEIETIDQFRKVVPIQRYSDFATDVEAMIENSETSLVASSAIFFAVTSGTNGSPKMIPVTEELLSDYRRTQKICVFHQYQAISGLYQGNILGFMSPFNEGYTQNKIPFGSMSGLLYQNSSALVKTRFSVPFEIFSIPDYDTKYLLIALFALVSPPISMMTAPNSSSLLRLQDLIKKHRTKIADILEAESLITLGNEAIQFEASFAKKATCARAENKQVIAILRSSEKPMLGLLFPEVKGIVTWIAGNCGIFAKKAALLFPYPVALLEAGYLASEFRGSFVVDPLRCLAFPSIHETFFEFIEVESWDSGCRDTKLVDELEDSRRYYVIATTKAGLYRYFIDDIILVQQSPYSTPYIKFLQKGKGVTSITGEKLYEQQVLDAIQSVSNKVQIEIRDYLLTADIEQSRYVLLYEGLSFSEINSLIAHLDQALCEQNIEYKAKRDSSRLGTIASIELKPGTFVAKEREWIEKHKGAGQYKQARLCYSNEELSIFAEKISW